MWPMSNSKLMGRGMKNKNKQRSFKICLGCHKSVCVGKPWISTSRDEIISWQTVNKLKAVLKVYVHCGCQRYTVCTVSICEKVQWGFRLKEQEEQGALGDSELSHWTCRPSRGTQEHVFIYLLLSSFLMLTHQMQICCILVLVGFQSLQFAIPHVVVAACSFGNRSENLSFSFLFFLGQK